MNIVDISKVARTPQPERDVDGSDSPETGTLPQSFVENKWLGNEIVPVYELSETEVLAAQASYKEDTDELHDSDKEWTIPVFQEDGETVKNKKVSHKKMAVLRDSVTYKPKYGLLGGNRRFIAVWAAMVAMGVKVFEIPIQVVKCTTEWDRLMARVADNAQTGRKSYSPIGLINIVQHMLELKASTPRRVVMQKTLKTEGTAQKLICLAQIGIRLGLDMSKRCSLPVDDVNYLNYSMTNKGDLHVMLGSSTDVSKYPAGVKALEQTGGSLTEETLVLYQSIKEAGKVRPASKMERKAMEAMQKQCRSALGRAFLSCVLDNDETRFNNICVNIGSVVKTKDDTELQDWIVWVLNHPDATWDMWRKSDRFKALRKAA